MKTLKVSSDRDLFRRNSKHMSAFRIFTWFTSRGVRGGTVDECEAALTLRHQTASPRVHELARVGCLSRTDQRRATRSKRTATVYVYNEGASFIAYLGVPPLPRTSKKAGLNEREQAMLTIAKSYVDARPKARSPEQIKRLMLKLVRTLNGIASVPEKNDESV